MSTSFDLRELAAGEWTRFEIVDVGQGGLGPEGKFFEGQAGFGEEAVRGDFGLRGHRSGTPDELNPLIAGVLIVNC